MAKGRRGGQGKRTLSKKIQSAKDFESLENELKKNGITMTQGIKNQKFDETKQAMAGAIHVLEEFGVKGFFIGFEQSTGGVMSASRFRGNINFTERYFNPGSKNLDEIMNGSPYHPKNQNAFSTGAHEAGHIVEGYIYKKENLGMDDLINRTVAKEIVSEASKEMKRIERASGIKKPMGINQQVASISGYATKNRSETMAEAIADHVANGENAKLFSREIVKQIKKRIGI